MFSIFMLGLLGSVSHCVGMCGGVMVVLQQASRGRLAWFFIHAGRITGYGILGFLFGMIGEGISSLSGLRVFFSFLLAVFTFYMAAAFATLVPSPEILLTGWISRWGQLLRTLNRSPHTLPIFLGLLWGFLPCGLVLSALLLAASESNAFRGVTLMLIFGLATLPALLIARRLAMHLAMHHWGRSFASLLMAAIGFQLTMRGLVGLGLMPHFMFGPFMLW